MEHLPRPLQQLIPVVLPLAAEVARPSFPLAEEILLQVRSLQQVLISSRTYTGAFVNFKLTIQSTTKTFQLLTSPLNIGHL